jgi:RimJ/RimL family protein N-acetyltransferase
MLDAANYCAIEKLRDGRNYIIRAQRRDDDIIDALHLRAGLRTFYLRLLTRKHRLNNFERQVALLADLHGEIIGGARYYIWSPGQADIAFIVGDAYQNKGIASVMLRHLAFIARDAGISDLHAHTLPDNRRALRVLDKLGLSLHRRAQAQHDARHPAFRKHSPSRRFSSSLGNGYRPRQTAYWRKGLPAQKQSFCAFGPLSPRSAPASLGARRNPINKHGRTKTTRISS